MGDVETMKARVFELNRMSAALDEERKALELKIAESAATLKVGQRVLWRKRGEYEITHIGAGGSLGQPKYIGRKVLKSGELGKATELWGADFNDSTIRPA